MVVPFGVAVEEGVDVVGEVVLALVDGVGCCGGPLDVLGLERLVEGFEVGEEGGTDLFEFVRPGDRRHCRHHLLDSAGFTSRELTLFEGFGHAMEACRVDEVDGGENCSGLCLLRHRLQLGAVEHGHLACRVPVFVFVLVVAFVFPGRADRVETVEFGEHPGLVVAGKGAGDELEVGVVPEGHAQGLGLAGRDEHCERSVSVFVSLVAACDVVVDAVHGVEPRLVLDHAFVHERDGDGLAGRDVERIRLECELGHDDRHFPDAVRDGGRCGSGRRFRDRGRRRRGRGRRLRGGRRARAGRDRQCHDGGEDGYPMVSVMAAHGCEASVSVAARSRVGRSQASGSCG